MDLRLQIAEFRLLQQLLRLFGGDHVQLMERSFSQPLGKGDLHRADLLLPLKVEE